MKGKILCQTAMSCYCFSPDLQHFRGWNLLSSCQFLETHGCVFMTSRWKTYGISHRIMLTNQQNTAVFCPETITSQVCLQQKAAARYGHLWSSFSKRARWSCAKKCSWRKISVTWAKATARCHARGFSKKGGSFCLGHKSWFCGFCGWFFKCGILGLYLKSLGSCWFRAA